jgi:hypothetical protein
MHSYLILAASHAGAALGSAAVSKIHLRPAAELSPPISAEELENRMAELAAVRLQPVTLPVPLTRCLVWEVLQGARCFAGRGRGRRGSSVSVAPQRGRPVRLARRAAERSQLPAGEPSSPEPSSSHFPGQPWRDD